MPWFDVLLPGKSDAWRTYRQAAKRNCDELRAVVNELRARTDAAPRNAANYLPLVEPTIEQVKAMYAAFEARRSKPPPTIEEIRKQVAASLAYR